MIELSGLNVSERQKSIILDKMDKMGHEQVVFLRDKETGLKAIIAIHNTIMGPSLGGVRMWNYRNEIEALEMLGQLLIIQKKYVEAQNVYIDLNHNGILNRYFEH